MSATRAALPLACVLAMAACDYEPVTEIIVVADTDLSVPDEIDTVRITASDSQEPQEAIASFGGGAPRPAVLGLVSRTGSGALDVAVIGELGGVEVLRRTARVSFVRGRVVSVRLDLWRRCLAETCGESQTCGDAGCRSTDVDQSELTDWRGSPPSLVGGDADALDGAVGAACTSAADCDDGWTCTADSCDGGRCAHAGRDEACDDGLGCTTERCDLFAGCVYETSDDACNDGIACTTDVCDRLLGCRSSPVHDYCAPSAYCDETSGCTVAPRFEDLYATIVATRCGPCHTTAPFAGELDMSSEIAARESLVDVTATCGGGVNTRVIPGDASHSLLYRKLAGVDLCGVRMPRLMTPLDDAEIEAIAHWIESGAR